MEILKEVLKKGNVSIPIILLENYAKLGLNEMEFMTLLHVSRFVEEGTAFPTPEEIVARMSINSEECSNILRNLVRSGFLMMKQMKDSHYISEYYSIEPLWDKLILLLSVVEQQKSVNNNESLYTIFEQEFGRPLSPLECETLISWEEHEEHTPIMIKSALKEAVISGKLNFKYIDRILFEWKKNGIKTPEQAIQQGKKFRQFQSNKNTQQSIVQNRKEVSFYNWLES